MNESFFNSEERLQKLRGVAASWLGTPFMPNGGLKGRCGGVSCQRLASEIYIECGAVPKTFTVPDGDMNWSHSQKESLFEKFFQEDGAKHFTEVKAWQAGDMIGFVFGGCIHHCGVVVTKDGQIVHCMRNTGVAMGHIKDAAFFKRIGKIWRPTP